MAIGAANLALEDAFIPILKSVYNLPHLTNLNRKQKNFPGIDIGDDHDRVAFQISAEARHAPDNIRSRGGTLSYIDLAIHLVRRSGARAPMRPHAGSSTPAATASRPIWPLSRARPMAT